MQRLKFFNPEYVIDKAAEIRMGKSLARKGFEFVRGRKSKEYECHILTAEQAEYIAQHKDTNLYIDIDFEVNVPREILIAGDDAKITDICKAREFLDQTGGKMEEAQIIYNRYIKDDREIKYTNNDTLPF
jgi:hypothetical protein